MNEALNTLKSFGFPNMHGICLTTSFSNFAQVYAAGCARNISFSLQKNSISKRCGYQNTLMFLFSNFFDMNKGGIEGNIGTVVFERFLYYVLIKGVIIFPPYFNMEGKSSTEGVRLLFLRLFTNS